MIVAGQPAVNYTFDAANDLTQITQGTSGVSFTYDAASRRTSLTLPNSITAEYSYDSASELTGLSYQVGQQLIHLWSDFWSIDSDLGALFRLWGRLLGRVAGGFVLGWLTQRSRSIWPGVLAHSVYDAFAGSLVPRAPVHYFVFLWILIAVVLFRYWPVRVGQPDRGKFICAT